MTTPESFIHTDNRVFQPAGEVPHTTRDGRQITLKVWSTTCLAEGCATTLAVRTATDRPQEWSNFEPAKYCPMHRHQARRAARISPEGKAAQLAGFRQWVESPEYKSMIANRLGIVERTILDAIRDFELVTDSIRTHEVVESSIARLEGPAVGKRDNRRFRVMRALTNLSLRNRLHFADQGSVVRLGPRPKHQASTTQPSA